MQKNKSNDSLYSVIGDAIVEGIQGGDDKNYSIYQNDPAGFLKDVMKERHLWDKLIEICESVRDNEYTAVVSANSVGKTYTAGRIVHWFLNSFQYSCKIITTAAPPERQIKELLWGEIRDSYHKAIERGAKLVGREPGVMTLRVSDTWWAQGFTIPMTGTREDRLSRFQGHHAEHLLFIVDEAHGVPPEIYEAIDSCMSGGHNRLLLLSNPLAPSGPFYESAIDPKFHTIYVSAFDHPNVKTGRILIPGAITRQKTTERIENWSRPLYEGEVQDSSCFQVPDYFKGDIAGTWRKTTMPFLDMKTLARFPSQSENALISVTAIRAAQLRWIANPPLDIDGIAGLDVAEYGPDYNAWIVRRGHWVSPILRWNGIDPIKTGGKATQYVKEQRVNKVVVDATGVGSGVAPHLVTNDIDAIGVKSSQSPTVTSAKSGEFFCLRDQLFWAIKEWIESPDAMLPPDPQLAQELAILTYEVNIKGKIQILAKPLIRELISRSPDAADALALTFYTAKAWKSIGFIKV